MKKIGQSPSYLGLNLSKPTPKFMTYRETVEHFELLSSATSKLCELLLSGEAMTPQQRAELLALSAILKGSSDGS